MSLNNKKSKLLRALDVMGVVLGLIFCALYPGWWSDGYLSNWYLKIAVGIAVYGGTLASVWWLYKDIKSRGW